MSLSLPAGHFSVRVTSGFNLSLSCLWRLHSYIIWSTDCSPSLQGHIGLSIILYLFRYVLMLPCLVIIVVKLGVVLILNFSLSPILGKKDFVISPFVVLSHSLCHCKTLCSLRSPNTTLFGTLL